MNHIFEARGFFTVPDGTDVSPFLNATDVSQNDVPWASLGEMSIAAGRIGPGTNSWIHVHVVVTQVTYILGGSLTVRMKDVAATDPYDLKVRVGQAVLTEPGTLFQLRNDSNEAADVLYVVSPSYVFEMEGGEVKHDDAIVVAKTWDEVKAHGDKIASIIPKFYEVLASREEAKRRLAMLKGRGPKALSGEDVASLPPKYDYLAPDKSEIRLLVPGEHGGFAHCVLPASKVSAPVRHRTVEELWYVLEGAGEIWRGREGEPAR